MERRGVATAAGTVGILIGLLFASNGARERAVTRADRALAMLSESERRLAVSDKLVAQLTEDRDLLQAHIEGLSADVTPPIAAAPPCEERDTPVFPRDSQFNGRSEP